MGALRNGRCGHAGPRAGGRRDYMADERTALGDAMSVLGQTTFDIYLNGNAYWRNVPAAVWRYKLGGYQVLKKWFVVPGTRCPPPPTQARGKSSTSLTRQDGSWGCSGCWARMAHDKNKEI